MEISKALGLLSPALMSALLAACSQSSPPQEWHLADGRPLDVIAGDSAPAVAVIMDPAECFQCGGSLPAWLDWKQRSGEQFFLIFSRAPTEKENRILVAAGLSGDGVLADAALRREDTPVELVFHSGQIVYRDFAATASPLLGRLGNASLRDFATSQQFAAIESDSQP
jgi:hypothetical protein